MPQYVIERPGTSESIDITARNDRAARKKTRSRLASDGVLEYKWHKDTTYRVLVLYRFMGDDADVTHEFVGNIRERVGFGNIRREATA